MKRLALALALGACQRGSSPSSPSSPAGPAPADVPARGPGPATAVITLPPGISTPVLDGPFLVTTVNPGSSMDFALAPTGGCAGGGLAWFGYSGGGVAIGAGQTLCVRSNASTARTNGFSGYDPSAAPRP